LYKQKVKLLIDVYSKVDLIYILTFVSEKVKVMYFMYKATVDMDAVGQGAHCYEAFTP